jgi:hypothetical protein
MGSTTRTPTETAHQKRRSDEGREHHESHDDASGRVVDHDRDHDGGEERRAHDDQPGPHPAAVDIILAIHAVIFPQSVCVRETTEGGPNPFIVW